MSDVKRANCQVWGVDFLDCRGEDSISPLRKALVESVPPLCGKISEGLHEYRTQFLESN